MTAKKPERAAILSIGIDRTWWRGQVFWHPTTVRYSGAREVDGVAVPALRKVQWLCFTFTIAEPKAP